jgi:CheY-like chemotaxis protein
VGSYVYVMVSDTGVGMSDETKSKLFDPFFTTKFTGRGLGMAAVLGIVRSHDGAVHVSTEVGKGTSFKVLFPPSGRAVDVAAPNEGDLATWRGSGTVLVVDDEDAVRAVARQILESVGFDVLVAADGHEAIETFRHQREKITAVFLDVTMPKMDGVETFRELRRLAADVRVILTSGYSEHRLTDEGLAGFIQKPYRPAELIKMLHDVTTG